MLNSVRFRLTGWYVGLLSLVLVGFSIGVYELLAQNVRADADRQLVGAVDILTRSLRHEVEEHKGKLEGEPSFQEVISTVYRDSFPGIAIAVYENTRQVAVKPGPGGSIPSRTGTRSRSPVYELMSRNNEPWRLAAQSFSVTGAGEYEFVATASVAPVEAQLAGLRQIFFLAIPLALAAAAIGGFLLARKSLAPVVEMSQTANRISSKDLSQRIATGNPRDELGMLAATLNRLLGRLEGSFALQRQFMEDSSHELRTPIYVAHTAAQVTLEQSSRTEEEYREALTTIDQQLRRLQHIVEDMFVLARADAGAYPLQAADYDLGETVFEAVRAAALLGARQGVSVTGPALTELPGYGDEGLIRQVILILLDNAVKFTPKGGHVEVSVDQSDAETYSVVVRDTGPGIPAESQGRIFERFFRVDKSRSRTAGKGSGGAGLGLSIAKWITAMHGGSLSLMKSDANGSAFRATILRRPATAANSAVKITA
ncbi:MAG: ATP-binding protein [Bryobacteraceae bacterium]